MMQNLAVALIVLCAAVFTVRKYLPAVLREQLVFHLRRRGASESKLADWFDTSSNCGGGCDSCKSCETAGKTPGTPPSSTEHVIRIIRR